MAGYAQGMQQFGNAGPAMGRIQSLNNFNQQFGGRNILGAGQKTAQPMQQPGPMKPMNTPPMLSNGWFGNILSQAQNYLRGI